LSIESFVAALPKVELHVHLEGAMRPATLLALARRNRVPLPADDVEGLREWFRFRDFDQFVDVYLACSAALKTPEDFQTLVADFAADQERENVRYTEINFTIGTHWLNGLPADEILDAMTETIRQVERERGLVLRLIPDIVRDVGDRTADPTLEWALAGQQRGVVVALGLTGREAIYPSEPFGEHFEEAVRRGLHATAHAGEHGGPEVVAAVLDHCRAERIGHGVRVVDDAGLVERLRRELAALPQPLEARIGGDAVQMAESVAIVTGDQLQSIALALALIYACLALQFASWRVGLMATLPTLLQTAIYFGALGISGIPLNATTSLVECLVLGLAIDDTIHYLARFNHAARRKASEAQGAVIALGAVLRPVTLTKAILGLGFIVLLTGELRNQVLFGWLAATTLLVAWLVDLFVTPAFMSGVRVVTLWDSLRLNLGADVQKTIPLLAGLSRRQARVFALMANLQTLPAGTRLMSEGESCGDGRPGDPAGDVYVVVDGELQIWVERDGEKQLLNTLGRGAVVGEIGYFGQKRIANVDTLTSTRLLRFDDADQERICRQYPRIAARVFLNLNRLQAERRASQAHLTG